MNNSESKENPTIDFLRSKAKTQKAASLFIGEYEHAVDDVSIGAVDKVHVNLIKTVLQMTGLNVSIETDDILPLLMREVTVKAFLEERATLAPSLATYPLKKSPSLLGNIELFFYKLYTEINLDVYTEVNFNAVLMDLLINMSSAQVRTFRHTSIVALKSIIDATTVVRSNLINSMNSSNDDDSKLYRSCISLIDSSTTKLIKDVVDKRWRDVCPLVSARSIYLLESIILSNTSVYLTDDGIKYLGWALSAPKDDTKIASLHVLKNLVESGHLDELQELFKRFQEKIFDMVNQQKLAAPATSLIIEAFPEKITQVFSCNLSIELMKTIVKAVIPSGSNDDQKLSNFVDFLYKNSITSFYLIFFMNHCLALDLSDENVFVDLFLKEKSEDEHTEKFRDIVSIVFHAFAWSKSAAMSKKAIDSLKSQEIHGETSYWIIPKEIRDASEIPSSFADVLSLELSSTALQHIALGLSAVTPLQADDSIVLSISNSLKTSSNGPLIVDIVHLLTSWNIEIPIFPGESLKTFYCVIGALSANNFSVMDDYLAIISRFGKLSDFSDAESTAFYTSLKALESCATNLLISFMNEVGDSSYVRSIHGIIDCLTSLLDNSQSEVHEYTSIYEAVFCTLSFILSIFNNKLIETSAAPLLKHYNSTDDIDAAFESIFEALEDEMRASDDFDDSEESEQNEASDSEIDQTVLNRQSRVALSFSRLCLLHEDFRNSSYRLIMRITQCQEKIKFILIDFHTELMTSSKSLWSVHFDALLAFYRSCKSESESAESVADYVNNYLSVILSNELFGPKPSGNISDKRKILIQVIVNMIIRFDASADKYRELFRFFLPKAQASLAKKEKTIVRDELLFNGISSDNIDEYMPVAAPSVRMAEGRVSFDEDGIVFKQRPELLDMPEIQEEMTEFVNDDNEGSEPEMPVIDDLYGAMSSPSVGALTPHSIDVSEDAVDLEF